MEVGFDGGNVRCGVRLASSWKLKCWGHSEDRRSGFGLIMSPAALRLLESMGRMMRSETAGRSFQDVRYTSQIAYS